MSKKKSGVKIKKWISYKNKKELKRKKIRKIKRLIKLNLTKHGKKQQLKNINIRDHIELKIPKNFSYIHNTEEINSFFDSLLNYYKNLQSVKLDFTDVEFLTFDAIVILIAHIKQYGQKVITSGNYPTNTKLKKLFIESGFFDLVNDKSQIVNSFKHNSIGKIINHAHFTEKVKCDISGQVTSDIINHTFGGKRRTDIHPIIIECMANTENHSGGENDPYKWWLSYYKNPETLNTEIVFLDLGLGILKTVHSKWSEIFFSLGIRSNVEKLRCLMNGEVYNPSRTGERKRGKGLIKMKDFSNNKEDIRNFTIISNGVYGGISENKFLKLNKTLNGTFIYWEMLSNIN